MRPTVCFLVIFICVLTNVFSQEKGKFIYDSKGKRDPFFQIKKNDESEAVEAVEADLTPREKLEKMGVVVSSIVWDSNNPTVLIGDYILEVGQEVNGVIIRAIEETYVVFEVEGQLIEVSIN